MDDASEAILALKPVTLPLQERHAKARHSFGLIAEEVAEVNPDLVVRDKNGEILQRALRPGERDVAQRVPERAPQAFIEQQTKWKH